MQNEDEGEWSDGQSEIAAEAKRSPKLSKKRKLSISSSSSIMAGFCSSNYQKKQTEGHFGQLRWRGRLARNVFQTPPQEIEIFITEASAKDHPQSFHEYLRRVLDIPNTEIPRRITIHSHSGDTGNHKSAPCRSFMAASFRPVKVGQVAGSEIQHTFPGDVFPQFTHHGKSDYHCELCSPFLRWAKKNGVKHSAYKSTKVTTDDIINDTAII